MNGRTAKLLRSYARSTGTTLNDAKHHWLTTPRNERGGIRDKMERSLWRKELQEFRRRHNLQGKEAAGALNVPYDTWRKWEAMMGTPPRWAQIALRTMMRDFKKPV